MNRVEVNYRVRKHDTYDEFCKVVKTYYSIQELGTGIFGGPTWKTLTHMVGSGMHISKIATRFESEVLAMKVIGRLVKGTPQNTTVSKVVS